jgi:NTP pyrophosphatase (non-canonical NTP hydrolase)
MNLAQLTDRALRLRERFAEAERLNHGRPWSTEEIMQGFVGDVGDLMKLVMAKAGTRHVDDVDRKLAHELADCLWSILVLASAYRIDLEKEFIGTVDQLEAQLAARIAAKK